MYERRWSQSEDSLVESRLLTVVLDRVAVRARHRLRTPVTVVPGETSHHDRLRRGARTPTRRPAERGVEGAR